MGLRKPPRMFAAYSTQRQEIARNSSEVLHVALSIMATCLINSNQGEGKVYKRKETQATHEPRASRRVLFTSDISPLAQAAEAYSMRSLQMTQVQPEFTSCFISEIVLGTTTTSVIAMEGLSNDLPLYITSKTNKEGYVSKTWFPAKLPSKLLWIQKAGCVFLNLPKEPCLSFAKHVINLQEPVI